MKNTFKNPRVKWGVVAIAAIIAGIWLAWATSGSVAPKQAQAKASNEPKTEQAEAAKDEWLLRDFKVVDGKAVYDPALNPQGKVASNGSDKNAIPTGSSQEARDKVDDYMRHSASALWATAYPQGLTGSVKNYINEWIDVHDGKAYLNKTGQEVYYTVKAFLANSEVEIKQFSNLQAYATGVGKNGELVVSDTTQDLSGQDIIVVKNKPGVKNQYEYWYVAWCYNLALNGQPPFIPQASLANPPVKPKANPKTPPVTPPTTPPVGEQPAPKNVAEAPQNNPKVVAQDPYNVRPAANGPEEGGVNQSPGTSYQGTPADVQAAQQAAVQAAQQAAAQQAAQQAAAQQAHQQAQQQAAAALAQQQAAAAAAAQQAQNAQQQQAAQQQQQQVTNQQQAQEQTNNGTVSGDDW